MEQKNEGKVRKELHLFLRGERPEKKRQVRRTEKVVLQSRGLQVLQAK